MPTSHQRGSRGPFPDPPPRPQNTPAPSAETLPAPLASPTGLWLVDYDSMSTQEWREVNSNLEALHAEPADHDGAQAAEASQGAADSAEAASVAQASQESEQEGSLGEVYKIVWPLTDEEDKNAPVTPFPSPTPFV